MRLLRSLFLRVLLILMGLSVVAVSGMLAFLCLALIYSEYSYYAWQGLLSMFREYMQVCRSRPKCESAWYPGWALALLSLSPTDRNLGYVCEVRCRCGVMALIQAYSSMRSVHDEVGPVCMEHATTFVDTVEYLFSSLVLVDYNPGVVVGSACSRVFLDDPLSLSFLDTEYRRSFDSALSPLPSGSLFRFPLRTLVVYLKVLCIVQTLRGNFRVWRQARRAVDRFDKLCFGFCSSKSASSLAKLDDLPGNERRDVKTAWDEVVENMGLGFGDFVCVCDRSSGCGCHECPYVSE